MYEEKYNKKNSKEKNYYIYFYLYESRAVEKKIKKI